MIEECVALSYHKNSQISENFTLIVSDAITKSKDISYPLMKVLCLSFYKMSDPKLSIRKAGTNLLHWLSTRFFRTHLMVLYNHTISQSPIYYISKLCKVVKLFAKKHEDLLIDVIKELTTRLPNIVSSGRYRVASIIIPLLTRLDLETHDNSIQEALIKTLLLLSNDIVNERPDLVENIWKSLIKCPSNVKIITNYFIAFILVKQSNNLTNLIRDIMIHLVNNSSAADFIFNRLVKDIFSTSTRPITPHEIPSFTDNQIILNNHGDWKFTDSFHQTFNIHLSKGNYSLIILSELVLVPNTPWKEYLSSLIICSFLSMDHANPIVYESAKILLRNILSCSIDDLSFTHPLSLPYKKISEIIEESGSNPIWNVDDEESEIFTNVLSYSLEILIPNNNDFQNKLSDETLQVAARINLDPHLICRALSMYKNIGLVNFDANEIHELMGVLLLHIQSRESRSQVRTLTEIQAIFEYIIDKSSPEDLIKIPKIFWCGVALLRSDISQDYLDGVAIISGYIDKVNIHDTKVQDSLNSCYPYSWLPTFPGLGILLLKGVCSKRQEESSRRLLSKLIIPDAENISIIDVVPGRANVVFIISMLPHILTFLGGENAENIAKTISQTITNSELSGIFSEYPIYRTSLEGLRRFLLEVLSKFTGEYFPMYESFVFTLLIGMLEKGPKCHCKTILQIIEALLDHVDFEKSKLFDNELAVFAPILNFLKGDLWPQALGVIKTILNHSKAGTRLKLEPEQIALVRSRLAQCQKVSDYWNQLEHGKAHVFSALAKVMDSENFDMAARDAHKATLQQMMENYSSRTKEVVKEPSSPKSTRKSKKRRTSSKPEKSKRRLKSRESKSGERGKSMLENDSNEEFFPISIQDDNTNNIIENSTFLQPPNEEPPEIPKELAPEPIISPPTEPAPKPPMDT